MDPLEEENEPEAQPTVENDPTKECIDSSKWEVTEIAPLKDQIDSEMVSAVEISMFRECTHSGKDKLTEIDPPEEPAGLTKSDLIHQYPDLSNHTPTTKIQMNIGKAEENSALETEIDVSDIVWTSGDGNTHQFMVSENTTSTSQNVDVSSDIVPSKSVTPCRRETHLGDENQVSCKTVLKNQCNTIESYPTRKDNSCTDKIVIPYTHDQAQVWDPEVVMKLWTEHGIVGQLAGALPRKPQQNGVLGLPLNLMKEEVRLLQAHDIGLPVIYKDFEQEASEEIKLEFEEQCRKCFEEQIEEAKAQKKREIEMKADRILAGKRKKFEERKRKREEEASNEQSETGKCRKKVIDRFLQKEVRPKEEEEEEFPLTRKIIIEEEVAKIRNLSEDKQVVEIFTQHPLINHHKAEPYIPTITDNKKECTRSAVFNDLWKRGYYVTQGLKFGGDFLAYTGDPHLYHACFIVRCVEDLDNVSHRDLVAATRIAASTKKTFVLAVMKKESTNAKVTYRSFQVG